MKLMSWCAVIPSLSTSSQALCPFKMPSATQTPFQVMIKDVPSVRVIGLREVVANYQSQGPLWGRVLQFAASHNISLRVGSDGACFAIFYDVGYKPSDVDTEVCVPIDAPTSVPEDELKEFKVYDTAELPRAASVTHVGAYAGLKDTYAQLFGWIAASGENASGPCREIYHVGMDKYDGDESKLVTEIIVPLA